MPGFVGIQSIQVHFLLKILENSGLLMNESRLFKFYFEGWLQSDLFHRNSVLGF